MVQADQLLDFAFELVQAAFGVLALFDEVLEVEKVVVIQEGSQIFRRVKHLFNLHSSVSPSVFKVVDELDEGFAQEVLHFIDKRAFEIPEEGLEFLNFSGLLRISV